MVFIYVIKLEKNKFYVGKTNNPEFRIKTHVNSNGSDWTRKYKPLRLIELKPDCDDFDEDKTTIQYMAKYGIDNVRGGSFVSLNLKQSVIDTINKMILGSNNNCFVCGKYGHFAKDCEFKEEESYSCSFCGKDFETLNGAHFHENVYCKKKYYDSSDSEEDRPKPCYRCGRTGHFISDCFASRHIKGYFIS